MRNLLALIGLAVVLFFGLGWYFQWYTFSIQSTDNGRKRIELDVDTIKIVSDTKSGVEKVGAILDAPKSPAPSSEDVSEMKPVTTSVQFENLPSFFRPSPPSSGSGATRP
jgi:hypothetical protein